MTIAEFLLARIAEDEVVARGATPGAWHADELYATVTADPYVSARAAYDRGLGEDCWVIPESMDSGVGDHNLAHIARHHPARVLAECEAKQRIVEALGDAERAVAGYDSADPNNPPAYWQAWGDLQAWREAAGYVAEGYADHPDYREEWRVS